jgi:hypothetical protein
MSVVNKNKALKKHLTLLSVIFAIAIPLINNFGLSLVMSNVYGDIMYTGLSDFLSAFISVLSALDLFAVFAVLVISLVRFGSKNSRDVITLCFVRIVIIYASYILIGAIVTENFANTLANNYEYFLVNAVIDVMLLVGAIILCLFLRSKYLFEENTDITVRKLFDKHNPLLNVILWTTVLISAFMLSNCIINTVSDIVTYGANDLSVNEVVYLVTPYAAWAVKTAACYFVMVFMAKWVDFLWKAINADPVRKSK